MSRFVAIFCVVSASGRTANSCTPWRGTLTVRDTKSRGMGELWDSLREVRRSWREPSVHVSAEPERRAVHDACGPWQRRGGEESGEPQ